MKSIFETLNSKNVNEHVEKKNGLSYLSWAWAWAEVKKEYPAATYTVYENENGWNYFTDGRTCWVKTGVTIEGLEHIEYLPVMDYRNQSITLDKVTSFNVNTAIQRSLTKACARHGLGLYIYAGEDLPEQAAENEEVANKTYRSWLDNFFADKPDRLAKFLTVYNIKSTDQIDRVLKLEEIDQLITRLKKESK